MQSAFSARVIAIAPCPRTTASMPRMAVVELQIIGGHVDLERAGYRYLLDWRMDDQPVWMRTRSGRILAVPYPQELNDSAAIIGRHVGAQGFADMVIDQLDEMLEQSQGRQPLVMGIALHAMIVGQPCACAPCVAP